MIKSICRLYVFYDGQFWVGVYEHVSRSKLSAARVVYGAEPKDYEICDRLNKEYYNLRFSAAVETTVKESPRNPKRAQREVHKEQSTTGISTKSEIALKMQQEECKILRKQYSREQREAEKELQFELKQQKRKDKHRGR